MTTLLKRHPGRTNDEHRFRRTLRFELRLSPIEHEALVQRWVQSGHNSLARHVRVALFGEIDPVALLWEQRKQAGLDRLKVLAELARIGSNVNQIARQLNRQGSGAVLGLEAQLEAVRIELSRVAVVSDDKGPS